LAIGTAWQFDNAHAWRNPMLAECRYACRMLPARSIGASLSQDRRLDRAFAPRSRRAAR
jgi:hypothetical protein